jgi:predicted negative regulator of RcsB-dependent stress response
MKKQILISVVFIIIGCLLGLFAVVNWQIHQEIKKTQLALDQDATELTKIEKFLNPTAESDQKK